MLGLEKDPSQPHNMGDASDLFTKIKYYSLRRTLGVGSFGKVKRKLMLATALDDSFLPSLFWLVHLFI